MKCDHSKDQDIEQLFKRVEQEQNGRLDLLVNNAYAAVNVSYRLVPEKVVSSILYIHDSKALS